MTRPLEQTSIEDPHVMNRTAQIVERIASSEIYKDYERAFSGATRLQLAFRPVEVWRFALENEKYENPSCFRQLPTLVNLSLRRGWLRTHNT
jgi:hypothetical protein